MPHTNADSLSFRNAFLRDGESRFAGPVAAITAQVLALRDKLIRLQTLSRAAAPSPQIRWFGFSGRHASAPRVPGTARRGQDMAARKLQDDLAHAADHGDVERIERAFDRRGAEGVHLWEWR